MKKTKKHKSNDNKLDEKNIELNISSRGEEIIDSLGRKWIKIGARCEPNEFIYFDEIYI